METSQQIQHTTPCLCQQDGQPCSKVPDRLFYTPELHCLPSCLPLPSLSYTVQSMEAQLRATPLVTQLPLGEGREFCGVIDLITMEVLRWERGTDGATFSRVPLQKGALSEATLKAAVQGRYYLAEQVQTCYEKLKVKQSLLQHCPCFLVYRLCPWMTNWWRPFWTTPLILCMWGLPSCRQACGD